MSLDFGKIQDYNGDRGFGFVSRTVWSSVSRPKKIFCHINKIKRKYSDLAHKLDHGLSLDVSFWYDTEITNKGEQVGELWLTVEEIPTPQRTSLVAHLESLWLDIEANTPSWLDQLTLELMSQGHREQLYHQRQERIGQQREAERILLAAERREQEEAERLARQRREQEEAERLARQRREQEEAERLARQRHEQEQAYIAQKEERKEQIQAICQQRGVTTCVHFTHVQNLRGILQNGLLSRRFLEQSAGNIQARSNDSLRLDKQREANCLSISFPNYRMFYKYRMENNNQADWVVLSLNASLLWELDCAFCKENAASSSVTIIPLNERKQVGSFQGMFEDTSQIRREDLGIPAHYPTNPQAEVLVFEQISSDYIKAVDFKNLEAARQWLTNNQQWLTDNENINKRDIDNFFSHGNHYFSPRLDYQSWNNNLVNLSSSVLDNIF
jgi:cold shock CspA family protein/flagellar biosynthesis GTPase FlhF